MVLPLKTGPIQRGDQYGVAKVVGIALEGGADYAITDAIVVRAAGHYERVGYTFKGEGVLTGGDSITATMRATLVS